MPTPPQVALDDANNTDGRIATLLDSSPLFLLIERAATEADELQKDFDVLDSDSILANKVRVWLARRGQLIRLGILISNAATAVRETN